MLPEGGVVGALLDRLAFSLNEGMQVFRLAIFSNEVASGDHLLNMRIFPFSYLPRSYLDGFNSFGNRWGCRSFLSFGFAMMLLATQRLTLGAHVSISSQESLNETLATQLYDWSKMELQEKGYLN